MVLHFIADAICSIDMQKELTDSHTHTHYQTIECIKLSKQSFFDYRLKRALVQNRFMPDHLLLITTLFFLQSEHLFALLITTVNNVLRAVYYTAAKEHHTWNHVNCDHIEQQQRKSKAQNGSGQVATTITAIVTGIKMKKHRLILQRVFMKFISHSGCDSVVLHCSKSCQLLWCNLYIAHPNKAT